MKLFLIVAAVIFGIAYFLPTIIAIKRDVPSKFWIFVLNLLVGLSGLGYALAFFYACGPSKSYLRWRRDREQLAIDADKAIVTMERRSR